MLKTYQFRSVLSASIAVLAFVRYNASGRASELITSVLETSTGLSNEPGNTQLSLDAGRGAAIGLFNQ